MKYLYDRAPIIIQNLLISIYGLKLKKERFSSCYRDAFSNIDFDVNPNDIELSKYIVNFLRVASNNVSFYRCAIGQVDFDSLAGVEEVLKRFPIIGKGDVQLNSKSFISDEISGKVIRNFTSGSTGSPLEIFMNSSSLQINYAFFHKFLADLGLDEFEKSATFAGRLIVPRGSSKPPYWRTNWAMKTLLLSSYHISEDNFRDYIYALESWEPKYIDSYPSAIYELAALSKQFNIFPDIKLQAIVTSSETLFKYQRDLIEEVFQCPVYDYYGCAEQAVVAFQMPREKLPQYQVPAQYCLVEVLDDQDKPVSPGQEGKLVCTNIFNSVMPLIRYDIGDSAVLGDYFEGTTFAKSLLEIRGRADDVIINGLGQKIGRLDPVFKGLSGIKEAQIIQHALDRLEVKIVRFNGFDIDILKITRLIQDRVGYDFTVDIRFVNSIPRTSSGKFRSVISKIS